MQTELLWVDGEDKTHSCDDYTHPVMDVSGLETQGQNCLCPLLEAMKTCLDCLLLRGVWPQFTFCLFATRQSDKKFNYIVFLRTLTS